MPSVPLSVKFGPPPALNPDPNNPAAWSFQSRRVFLKEMTAFFFYFLLVHLFFKGAMALGPFFSVPHPIPFIQEG